MRQFRFVTLDAGAFDEFSAHHPQGSFQQTSRMGAVRARYGVDVEYVGVEEEGRLVAAALLELHRSRLSTFAAVHDGPLCDYRDDELLAFLVGELRARAKRCGAAQLEVTPEVVYRVRDSAGRALPEGDGPRPEGVPALASAGAADDVVAALKALGFEHSGFVTGYTAVPRWRYVKDLAGIADEQALLATYAKYRRRNIRIARESFVHVRDLARDEMDLFQRLCDMSSEKQGFEGRDAAYYGALYDAFGDAARFQVAEIDLARYRAHWEAKLEKDRADALAVEARIAQGRANPKAPKRLEALRAEVDGAERRLAEADELIARDGTLVPIGCICYFYHEREAIALFAGNDEAYARFYGSALLHHGIMVDCVERGIPRYNFYGISGVFDETDPSFGVYEFKTRFNGYVEEMVGSFTLPVRPAVYAAKRLAHRVLGR